MAFSMVDYPTDAGLFPAAHWFTLYNILLSRCAWHQVDELIDIYNSHTIPGQLTVKFMEWATAHGIPMEDENESRDR